MLTATDWPAGPRGIFLLGNLPEISRNWLATLTRYAREYGDFVPLQLGPKRTVLVLHRGVILRSMTMCHAAWTGTGTRTGSGGKCVAEREI